MRKKFHSFLVYDDRAVTIDRIISNRLIAVIQVHIRVFYRMNIRKAINTPYFIYIFAILLILLVVDLFVFEEDPMVKSMRRNHFVANIQEEVDFLNNQYGHIDFSGNSFMLNHVNNTIVKDRYIDQFDVIIFLGPAIKSMADQTIRHTLKNVVGYREVYVVSPELYHNRQKSAYKENVTVGWIPDHFINEKLKSDYNYSFEPDHYRFTIKWRHQQIMKLYVSLLVQRLLNRVLIMDGEIFWQKQTTFIDIREGMNDSSVVGYFNRGYNADDSNNPFYTRFLDIIYPPLKQFRKTFKKSSFISHHMLLQLDILQSMMIDIERYHNRPFWHVFIHSGKCTEYELYGRYSMVKFPSRSRIRDLDYIDTGICSCTHPKLSYISCHHHLQDRYEEYLSKKSLYYSLFKFEDDCFRYKGKRLQK
jgi:hypothetical protein